MLQKIEMEESPQYPFVVFSFAYCSLTSPIYMVYLEKFNQVWVGRYDGNIVVYSSRVCSIFIFFMISLLIFNVQSYRQVDFWPAHTSRVNALLKVADNVWSCSDDGSICMWEAKV